MKNIWYALLACSIFLAHPQTGHTADPPGSDEAFGVVVVAHGAPVGNWNQKILSLLATVKCPYPLEPAFLDFDAQRTLPKAVKRLEARGIRDILAIHLSPSSYSCHHEEVRYLLGLRPGLGIYEQNAHPPVRSTSRFSASACMDEDPLVVQILTDYARELSKDPGHESLILVGHGPVEEIFDIMWSRQLERLGDKIAEVLPFREVAGMTLRLDSSDLIREHAVLRLHKTAQRMARSGRVIVLCCSMGPFLVQHHIKHAVKGIPSVVYSTKGIVSHPLAAVWIEQTIARKMEQPQAPPADRRWTSFDRETGKKPGTSRYGLLQD